MQAAKPGSDWDYAVRKHNKVGLCSLMLNTITPRLDSLIIVTIIMISALPKCNLHPWFEYKNRPVVLFILCHVTVSFFFFFFFIVFLL